MIEPSDLRMTRIALDHGAGHMRALGFGTLTPGAAVTTSATMSVLVWPVLAGLLSPRFMVAVRGRRSAQRAGQIIR